MGLVNADSTTVLAACQNIIRAVSSIEATKASVTRKYQQLGVSWNDKKYRELGDVIQECSKSLNVILNILLQSEKPLALLAKSLQAYEDTTLDTYTNQGQIAIETDDMSGALSSNGVRGFFARLFSSNQSIKKALKGVEHRPVARAAFARSEQQIISSISGCDMIGSCSSLAFAYAGNRAGYVVFDFRGGRSREVFSLRSSIEQIANMDGVNSVVLNGVDDTACVEQLMSHMESGRQYYMATGEHAAVVRLNNDGIYHYLELQNGNPSVNGWHSLTPWALSSRFRCNDYRSREWANYLIELDSLQNNTEFLDILGYINTDESVQIRR